MYSLLTFVVITVKCGVRHSFQTIHSCTDICTTSMNSAGRPHFQCVAVCCSVLQCVAVKSMTWVIRLDLRKSDSHCMSLRPLLVFQKKLYSQRDGKVLGLSWQDQELYYVRNLLHCNTLHTHCNTLQQTATHCNTQQHTATHCNTLQDQELDHVRNLLRCNTLQHTVTHCNTLQHTATHCNALQHTATRYQTLQHTTPSRVWRYYRAQGNEGSLFSIQNKSNPSFSKNIAVEQRIPPNFRENYWKVATLCACIVCSRVKKWFHVRVAVCGAKLYTGLDLSPLFQVLFP